MKEYNFKPEDVRIDEEFDSVLPSLNEAEYEALRSSLKEHGFKTYMGKIVVWYERRENYPVIVDGHNRFRICKDNDIPLSVDCFDVADFENRDEVKTWILETQMGRRNLSSYCKVELAENYRELFVKMAKKNMSEGGKGGLVDSSKVNTRQALAKIAGMSESKYDAIVHVINSDDEELKRKLREGEITAYKANQMLKKKKLSANTTYVKPDKITEAGDSNGPDKAAEAAESVEVADDSMTANAVEASNGTDAVNGAEATEAVGGAETTDINCLDKATEAAESAEDTKPDMLAATEVTASTDHDKASDKESDSISAVRVSTQDIQEIPKDFREKVGELIIHEFQKNNQDNSNDNDAKQVQWAKSISEFLINL